MASTEYLAGLFDGEGMFTLGIMPSINRKRPGTWRSAFLAVSLANTNEKLIDLVNKKWPGRVHTVKLKSNHKPCHTWRVYSSKAARVAEELWPHMIGKKEQAYILLMMFKLQQKWKHYGSYAKGESRPEVKEFVQDLALGRIRRLNKRGM